jgi:hypothetical protein
VPAGADEATAAQILASAAEASAFNAQVRRPTGTVKPESNKFFCMMMLSAIVFPIPCLFPRCCLSLCQVLAAFASVLYAVRPERVPGFAFAWLELASHRLLLPPLLQVSGQRGWPLVHRLVYSMMRFLYPALRRAELNEGAQLFHRGLLRVLLLLLHDFPDFLSDYAPSFCEVLPPLCIQMRNLVLSAAPRSLRVSDPFSPTLVMASVPECSVPPRLLWSASESLPAALRAEVDAYVRMPLGAPRAPSALFQVCK